MNDRFYAFFGVVGPLVAYISIVVAIALSPWFSWHRNALSDLGHSVQSQVAPIFNMGLLLAGFLILIYSVTVFRKHAKYTSFCMAISAFLLQLIATFNEVYGYLHFIVSVLFFVSIGIASLIYYVEKRSMVGLVSFIVCLLSWLPYELGMLGVGIAVPEIISSLAAAILLVSSSVKIYFDGI